jgi:hypothetical protein
MDQPMRTAEAIDALRAIKSSRLGAVIVACKMLDILAQDRVTGFPL